MLGLKSLKFLRLCRTYTWACVDLKAFDKGMRYSLSWIRAPFLPFLCLLPAAMAGNPLVPHVGMADPHVHVFNGKVYMYVRCTHGASTDRVESRVKLREVSKRWAVRGRSSTR